MQGPSPTAYGLAAAPEGAESLKRDLGCATCGCAMSSSDPHGIAMDKNWDANGKSTEKLHAQLTIC